MANYTDDDSSNESLDDELDELCYLVDKVAFKKFKKEIETIKAKITKLNEKMKKYKKEVKEKNGALEKAMKEAKEEYDKKVKELEAKNKELLDEQVLLRSELRQLKENVKQLSLNDDYIYFGAISHKIQGQIMKAMIGDLHLSRDQYKAITGYGIWDIRQYYKAGCLHDTLKEDSVAIDYHTYTVFNSNVSRIMDEIKSWYKGALLHFNASRNKAAHPKVDVSVDEIRERIKKSVMEGEDISKAESILEIVECLQHNHVI